MTRSLYAIPAALCLAAAVVSAQAPGGDKPASNLDKTTYVGCLKAGTSTGTWLLEHAAAPKAGATGSGGVGTSGKSTMTLNLHPAATVNLKAHANHKVEIVGTSSTGSEATAAAGAKGGEAAAGVAGATDAKGEAATPGAVGAQASGHHFSVESVKMVAATCP